VKIIGYNYRVIRDGLMDDMGAMGRFHPARLRIQVAEDISLEQSVSTVIHEVLEAVNYHLELGMEHRAVMALEAALYQVLTDAGVDLSPLSDAIEEVPEPAPEVRPIEYHAGVEGGPNFSVSCYPLQMPANASGTVACVSGESGGISAGVGE
jgi:hypothetical protein